MPAPITGQVAVTGTAQPLSATQLGELAGFTIRAPLTNVNAVFVGPATVTTGNGHQMDPGDSITYERIGQNGQPVYQLKPSDFWAVGTTPDRVTWLASP